MNSLCCFKQVIIEKNNQLPLSISDKEEINNQKENPTIIINNDMKKINENKQEQYNISNRIILNEMKIPNQVTDSDYYYIKYCNYHFKLNPENNKSINNSMHKNGKNYQRFIDDEYSHELNYDSISPIILEQNNYFGDEPLKSNSFSNLVSNEENSKNSIYEIKPYMYYNKSNYLRYVINNFRQTIKYEKIKKNQRKNEERNNLLSKSKIISSLSQKNSSINIIFSKNQNFRNKKINNYNSEKNKKQISNHCKSKKKLFPINSLYTNIYEKNNNKSISNTITKFNTNNNTTNNIVNNIDKKEKNDREKNFIKSNFKKNKKLNNKNIENKKSCKIQKNHTFFCYINLKQKDLFSKNKEKKSLNNNATTKNKRKNYKNPFIYNLNETPTNNKIKTKKKLFFL